MVTTMLGAFLAGSTALAPAPARGMVTAGRPVSVLTSPTATLTTQSQKQGDEPAVRVTLSGRNVYDPGDHVRVRVHVRDDSYLIVVHADAGGHVRVLYPVNPGDDNFVHAGEEFDVRGSGDNATLVVVDTRGKGTIYAAVSKDPYRFDTFVNGESWNAAAFPDTARGDAAEAVITEVVQQMAPTGGRFDYDLAVYTVTPRQHPQPTYTDNGPPPDEYAYATPQYYPQPYPVYYPVPSYYPYYDPWYWQPAFYNPWWWHPFFEDGFFEDEPFFSPVVGIGIGGCWGGCYGGFYGGGVYGNGGGYRQPLVYWNRPSAGVSPVGYRPRADFVPGRYGTLYPGHVGGFTTYRPRPGVGSRQPTIFTNTGLATSRGGIASVGFRTRPTTVTPTVFRQPRAAVGQPVTGRIDHGGMPGQVAQPRRAVPVPTRTVGTPVTPMTPHTSAPAPAVRARQPEGSYGTTGASGGVSAPRVESHPVPHPEPRSTGQVESPHAQSPHVETPHPQPRSTPRAYRATGQRVEPVPQPQYGGQYTARNYATPNQGSRDGSSRAPARYDAPPTYNSAPRYEPQPRRDVAPEQHSAPRYEAPPPQHYEAPRAQGGYSGGGGYSAPHVSSPAPRSSGGGGGYRGGGGGGGGGGSHGGGGGGHHR